MARLIVLLLILKCSFGLALVGGHPASKGQLPSVLVWTGEGYDVRKVSCTGTKVAAEWILTAAHCVLDKDVDFDGEAGAWSRSEDYAEGNALQFSFDRSLRGEATIEKVTIKEVRLPAKLEGCLQKGESEACPWRMGLPDVALIRVEATAAFLGAPSSKVSRRHIYPGTMLWMTGYGNESEKPGSEPPRLTYHLATVAPGFVLRWALRNTIARNFGFPSPRNFFGVYSNPKLPFHTDLGGGDSGGPVMSLSGKVVGVNSLGFCPLSHRGCEITNNSFFSRLDVVEPSFWPEGAAD